MPQGRPEILRSCYPVDDGAIATETLGKTRFGMAYFGITKGIIEGTIVYGDGHFKPYWGDIRIKKNGCLDTLHGYDFYEVEDRQYHNWLEAQERKLRGCMRRAFERINARAFTTPEGWRIHLER